MLGVTVFSEMGQCPMDHIHRILMKSYYRAVQTPGDGSFFVFSVLFLFGSEF